MTQPTPDNPEEAMQVEPRLIDAEELARWCEERADERQRAANDAANMSDPLVYRRMREQATAYREATRKARSLARTSPPSGEGERRWTVEDPTPFEEHGDHYQAILRGPHEPHDGEELVPADRFRAAEEQLERVLRISEETEARMFDQLRRAEDDGCKLADELRAVEHRAAEAERKVESQHDLYDKVLRRAEKAERERDRAREAARAEAITAEIRYRSAEQAEARARTESERAEEAVGALEDTLCYLDDSRLSAQAASEAAHRVVDDTLTRLRSTEGES